MNLPHPSLLFTIINELYKKYHPRRGYMMLQVFRLPKSLTLRYLIAYIPKPLKWLS